MGRHMQTVLMAMLMAALLLAVVYIYLKIQAQRPTDLQNDIMYKSSPAANPPAPIGP